ncbi:MAG: PAS domain-containing protein [Actinomycetota bacterium]
MTTYLQMQPAMRPVWKRSRYRRLALLVLVTGLSLVASAVIQLYSSRVLTLQRLKSGTVPRMTFVNLCGALILTILLAAMVRALAISNMKLAASEADARELLALQTRRFHALERDGWDGVMILDRMGAIRWMGVTAARILRLDPNDVSGASLLGLVDVRNIDDFLAALAIEKGASRKSFEFQMRDADGQLRWFEAVTTNHVDDEAVSGVVMHFRDASKKRDAVDAMRDRDGHVRAAFDRSPFGAAMVNAEGVLVSLNRALAGMAGRSVAALIGRRVGTLLSPRGRAAVRTAMRKLKTSDGASLQRETTLANGRPVVLALIPARTDGEEVSSFLLQVVALPEIVPAVDAMDGPPAPEPSEDADEDPAPNVMGESDVWGDESSPAPEEVFASWGADDDEPFEREGSVGEFDFFAHPLVFDVDDRDELAEPDEEPLRVDPPREHEIAEEDQEEPSAAGIDDRASTPASVLRAIISARRAEGSAQGEAEASVPEEPEPTPSEPDIRAFLL